MQRYRLRLPLHIRVINKRITVPDPYQGTRKITLRQFGSGLARITRDGASLNAFIFSLADVNDNSSLNWEEVMQFFGDFIQLITTLASSMLHQERPFLEREGVDKEVLNKQLVNIEKTKHDAESLVAQQLKCTFRVLDENKDSRITYLEWVHQKQRLPKMYHKVEKLYNGILNEDAPNFRMSFLENRDEHEEFDDLDLDPAQSILLLDMFNYHAAPGSQAMDQEAFSRFLIEGWSFSLFGWERTPQTTKRVRELIQSGAVTDHVDLNGRIFQRSFTFFEPKVSVS